MTMKASDYSAELCFERTQKGHVISDVMKDALLTTQYYVPALGARKDIN